MDLDEGMTTALGNQAETNQEVHSRKVPITVIDSGINFENHRRDYHKPRHLCNTTSPKAFSTLLPRDDEGEGYFIVS